MPQIIWNNRFNLKNNVLDEQHQRLVAIMNNLHDLIMQSTGLQSIAEVFSALVLTFRSHFTHEEQLMRQHAYPGLTQHKREHEYLMEQINVTSKGVASGNRELIRDFQQFVAGWWLLHMKNVDQELGPFLNNKM